MAKRGIAVEQDGPVPNAQLVIHGTLLTVDESQPTAEALAVADGRRAAVGSRADVEAFIGPNTKVLDIGDGCVMPGLVEAHGHPLMEAIALSDRLVDIRPVTSLTLTPSIPGRSRRGTRHRHGRAPGPAHRRRTAWKVATLQSCFEMA